MLKRKMQNIEFAELHELFILSDELNSSLVTWIDWICEDFPVVAKNDNARMVLVSFNC